MSNVNAFSSMKPLSLFSPVKINLSLICISIFPSALCPHSLIIIQHLLYAKHYSKDYGYSTLKGTIIALLARIQVDDTK